MGVSIGMAADHPHALAAQVLHPVADVVEIVSRPRHSILTACRRSIQA
jgi:hypothetical protein